MNGLRSRHTPFSWIVHKLADVGTVPGISHFLNALLCETKWYEERYEWFDIYGLRESQGRGRITGGGFKDIGWSVSELVPNLLLGVTRASRQKADSMAG